MKALVVAGGVPHIERIKQLKSRGIVTVLADGNSEAVARPYADKFYRVDIFDIPAVKIIAEKEQVDFVLTVCADQVLLVVAQVSEELGLPCYIDYETAQDVSDKISMRKPYPVCASRLSSNRAMPTARKASARRTTCIS